MKTIAATIATLTLAVAAHAGASGTGLVVATERSAEAREIDALTILTLGDQPTLQRVQLTCAGGGRTCEEDLDAEGVAKLRTSLNDRKFWGDRKPLRIEFETESSCKPKNCPPVLSNLGSTSFVSQVTAREE